MMIKPKQLKRNQIYYYWNKSTYETKPSLKACKLICLNSNGKLANVEREDLTVNRFQTIAASRLLEKAPEIVQGELLEGLDGQNHS